MKYEQLACDHGDMDAAFLAGLNRVATELEKLVNWPEHLSATAAGVAELLECSRCLILLSREGRVFQVAGAHPATLRTPAFMVYVARRTAQATGGLIWNPSLSSTSAAPEGTDGWTGRFLTAPIVCSDLSTGALIVDGPRDGRTFSGKDVLRLGTIGMVLGRAMQVGKLQNLLRSRFAQIALAGKPNPPCRQQVESVSLDAGRAARIVARTFYKEMTKAGFSSEDVIEAATEILSQLGHRVKRCNRHLLTTD